MFTWPSIQQFIANLRKTILFQFEKSMELTNQENVGTELDHCQAYSNWVNTQINEHQLKILAKDDNIHILADRVWIPVAFSKSFNLFQSQFPYL